MNPKTALITGVAGQDGSYLSELLLAKGYVVHGIVRPLTDLARSNIAHLACGPALTADRFFLHEAALGDREKLRRLFEQVAPSEVYHLAGQSHVGVSFGAVEATTADVALGTVRLLEITRQLARPPRFFHASSAEIFGSSIESPRTEETPMRPVSPYGCAKGFATQLGRVFRDSFGLFICNGILFNHESPRRGAGFVTRKIARAAARISLGLDDDLVLGDLRPKRDWGHAQDYVSAMWLMLQQDKPDDYVVATGELHSVEEFVATAFDAVNLPWQEYVRRDPALDRPGEPNPQPASPAKIQKKLGWKPTRSFAQLVGEMVEAEIRLGARGAASTR